MKLSQFFRNTRGVLAAIPVAVALLGGASYAIAQTTSTTLADPAKSIKAVTVSGSVPIENESVAFAGQVVNVGSTLSRDPDPSVPPQVMIDLKFLKVAGVGSTSKLKYISQTEIQLLRPLAATQTLEVTFPFQLDKPVDTQVLAGAKAGLATFNLTFDANGGIVSGTGTIAANKYAITP